MKIVGAYLLLINLTGFAVMGWDKSKARAGAWRIPEKTLFGIAILGGGLGVWAGMYHFHHKTRHWYFKYGIPFLFLLELLCFSKACLDFLHMK